MSSMQRFLGAPMQLVKFMSLTLALLLFAAAVVCLFFGTPRSIAIAIAASVVAAYALMLFFEAFKTEIVEALRERRDER